MGHEYSSVYIFVKHAILIFPAGAPAVSSDGVGDLAARSTMSVCPGCAGAACVGL